MIVVELMTLDSYFSTAIGINPEGPIVFSCSSPFSDFLFYLFAFEL